MKSDTIHQARAAHHSALLSLCLKPNHSGLTVWRKLRMIECLASTAATAYCNGEKLTVRGSRVYDFQKDGCEAWEAFVTREIEPAVFRIFGRIPDGFFVNGDPRGYALKIRVPRCNDGPGLPTAEALPAGLHTDWGGYGILAPEIR